MERAVCWKLFSSIYVVLWKEVVCGPIQYPLADSGIMEKYIQLFKTGFHEVVITRDGYYQIP